MASSATEQQSPVKIDVDVAVIGAGTAGLAAYRAAVAAGARTVLIEAGDHGTTCARVGCMPSKLLLAAAEAAHHARHSAPFGVHADVSVDGLAVMDRLRRERDRFVGFVVESVEKIPDEHRLIGRARFVAPGVLSLGDREVHTRATVIATGSSPVIPPVFDAVRERVVVNDHVFAWKALPASVAVFGTGVIGLELGQALSRLGVRVRIFGRGGAIGPLSDPIVKAAAERVFRAELAIEPDARVDELRLDGDDVVVSWRDGNEARTERFAYVLVAAGRRPNLAGLALENAGVTLDARGVPVFDRTTLQSGDSSVYIAGDANQDTSLLHEAADEGKIAGSNAAHHPNVTAGARRSPLFIVFSDPQIAIAGSRYVLLKERPNVVIGQVSFEDQGRSRIMLQNRGMARIYADGPTGRFLGAEMVGPRAEHMGHLLAWAHQQSLTVDQMLDMPFYHPVIEEGLRTALRDVNAQRAAQKAAANPSDKAAGQAA